MKGRFSSGTSPRGSDEPVLVGTGNHYSSTTGTTSDPREKRTRQPKDQHYRRNDPQKVHREAYTKEKNCQN